MGKEEDRRRGIDVSLCSEQHAHALVVGRGDALLSMEIIESSGSGGLCVLAGESPALGATEEKFASTKLWFWCGF